MGRRGRKIPGAELKLLAALDKAVAFERGLDRVRRTSPALFPPEVTCQKYMYEDGSREHVYHHPAVGEVGRIRVEDWGGITHIGGKVAGHTDDPLHEQRNALFGPLVEAFARADHGDYFQSTLFACERCGELAARLIFTHGPGRADFEECAWLMYPEYSRFPAPVWIIGPTVGDGPEPERPADIMKVWPQREPMQRLRPAQFNPLLDQVISEHCRDHGGAFSLRSENKRITEKRLEALAEAVRHLPGTEMAVEVRSPSLELVSQNKRVRLWVEAKRQVFPRDVGAAGQADGER